MTRRVIIDSTAASPLRVSVAGVDAATAEFNNLIFDGNQSPLRLAGTGFIFIEGMSSNEFNGGQNVREANAGVIIVTPAGTTAVFITMWRKDDGLGRVFTPSFQPSSNNTIGGGGGAICSNQFIGVCFNGGSTVSGNPDARQPGNYTNYCIFKNYN